jgi:hypothetical protein
VNGHAILLPHFVELVDAADAAVSEHHRATLQIVLALMKLVGERAKKRKEKKRKEKKRKEKKRKEQRAREQERGVSQSSSSTTFFDGDPKTQTNSNDGDRFIERKVLLVSNKAQNHIIAQNQNQHTVTFHYHHHTSSSTSSSPLLSRVTDAVKPAALLPLPLV